MRIWLTKAVKCFVLSGVLFASAARAQSDDDDDILLLTVPVIAAQARAAQQSGGAAASTPTPPANTGLTAIESDLLNAHNQARASARLCGSTPRSAVPALSWNTLLAEAARVHTEDMANNIGFLSHTGSDGSTVGGRVARTGYVRTAVGENIANGFNTVDSVINAFLNSEGHCNNIMGSRYMEIGAAKVGRFWTIVFARPR